ncbi:PREDICTED: carboxyl-terminal-processing peptidase 1, chloroplastic isoform X2 [Nelumbo nucifera]|uniref:C-terminal processing peptidase n=1 Tax=Nelumbo nucifera TaxID=4432 RepID=A0A1U7YWB5_NELNU|nr:PREDICTED: carboxyl-terminal-processing peptidase 1, chloroplastic isoform X2 [Nelumbo nucifera]
MRVLFSCSSSILVGATPLTRKAANPHYFSSPIISFNAEPNNGNHPKWPQKLLLRAFTAALSFGFIVSSPSSIAIAAQSPSLQIPPPPSPPSELCQEEEEAEEQTPEPAPEFVTNEAIVEEAWEIVNDSYLNTGRRQWSPDIWMQKKTDIVGSSIQTRSKAHDIIRRMLASLGDPYTRFLSPSEFSKMAKYDVTGIGVNLREVPDDNGSTKLKVLGIILDGPAHAAGVRQGDEVLSVNGVDVRGKSAFEVSSMLQGPNETFVTIEVKHGNCGPIQFFEVQRQLTARTPVFYRLEQMDNGTASVGYIRLKEFNALAKKDLVIAMKRLQDLGASYFVLDLRDNLGGLVQVGIEVAKLFLNEGETVTYTVGRDPQYQRNIVAENSPSVTSPVIVLVNGKTASASEIVATALHDNCRAVLVGERTYGKGLIQSVFELHDGSGVVVTVGKYVTPNHMDINGNGIEPDFRNIPVSSRVGATIS